MSGWDAFVGSAQGNSLSLPVQGFEESSLYGNERDSAENESPIFSLGLVQFSLPSRLHSLSCASNVLLLAVIGHPRPTNSERGGQPPQLVRIDLAKPTEVETIDLALPPPTLSREGALTTLLHKVHVDPTGRHVIVSTTTGDNFYSFLGTLPPGTGTSTTRRAKPLSKLKGVVIEAVSWSPSSSAASFSTREILLGTRTGQILETVLVDATLAESSSFSISVPGRSGATERYVKLLYTIPERQAIGGIRCDVWGRRAAIIVTTKSRIYQFIGSMSGRRGEEDGGMLEAAFQPYLSGDVQPKSLELPGEPPNSELHVFATAKAGAEGFPTSMNQPKSVAWLTGPGIYHGSLSFPSPSADQLHPGDGIIESASLIPYPTEPPPSKPLSSQYRNEADDEDEEGRTEVPLSMALTEWHFVLLYSDKVRVIELLSDKVVFEERLDLRADEQPIKISTDFMRKTYWLHTDQSIFELVVKEENRNVWKIYMNRSNWSESLRHATTPRQREVVNGAQADAFFAAGRYIQSAQHYALSSKSFEQVVLSFVDKNEGDALRYYLISKLERLKRTDLTQRMMLATWLVEIYLSKMNQLEDVSAAERASEDADNYLAEKMMIEEDLRQFLKTYQDNLDSRTVFDLIASHGRDDLILHFAAIVGDHERIITHWILEEDWTKALAALNSQDNLDPYYRFAPVLVRRSPQLCIETLMRQPSLDVRKLIPAFAIPFNPNPSASPTTSRDAISTNVIKYLTYSILQLQNVDTSVHNALITLYASDLSNDETELLHFLTNSPDNPLTGQPYYDLDFALRICKKKSKLLSCGLIYAKMNLFEISIDFALDNDDLELAKILADRPVDDDLLRKKLWLKIAKFVVGKKNDIKTAMLFLDSTDLLKIEDILPFFPDFVVIDDFKESICQALEGYSSHIESLKEDMDEATRSAQAIKSDIVDLKNRFVVVDPAEKCRSCGEALLTRQFYIFPCQHAFHADCLIKEVTQHLSPVALRRMLDLQSQLSPSSLNGLARSRRQATNGISTPESSNQISTRKLAVASVQGLDQLRKLVIPDALISIIGGAIPGSAKSSNRETGSTADKIESEEKERTMRRSLDELLASSCVLCDAAVLSVDRPFVVDGEEL